MSSRTRDAVVVVPGARVIPISKSNRISFWTTSGCDNDGCDNANEESKDLDCSGNDLRFAEELNAQEVNDQDQDQGYRDDYRGSPGSVAPVCNQDSRGRALGCD